MAVPQCNHIDEYRKRCQNDAQFRCTGPNCGNMVYCVEHSRMIDSKYICDNCLKEIEQANRETARKREEAERASRETAKRLAQQIALARELALAEARKNSKIRYPRIIFLLSLIMFLPALGIAFSSSGHTPIVYTPLTQIVAIIGALGGILLLSTWLWVIGLAIARRQWGWLTGLLLLSGLFWPLYLILDPME